MVYAGCRPGMKCLKEVPELVQDQKEPLGIVKKKKYSFS